jgi:hypothetical protein
MINIWLSGPLGRLAFFVIAIGGFLLALGEVLDIYIALWMFTLPATAVYGALLWCFALPSAQDGARPEGAGEWALFLVLKLGMTIALVLGTLGVIALGYDLYGLVLGNWPWIVLTIGLLAVIFVWTTLAEGGRARKLERAAGSDHPASRSARVTARSGRRRPPSPSRS